MRNFISCSLAALTVITALSPLVGLAGCGSGWRTHTETAREGVQPTTSAAPEWVRLRPPQMEGRVYFVGRSHTPDLNRSQRSGGSTPDARVGYTTMDERDAVQSARSDVHDQIRQRLAPRNMGTSGNVVSMNVDSGTCTDCGATIPLVLTNAQAACNEACYGSTCSTWPSTGQRGACATGACAKSDTQPATFVGSCGTCGSSRAVSGRSTGPITLVDALNASHRTPDYLPMLRGEMARDINVMNIGLDSVMPAMLAQLREEDVYFEKWAVHEGDDSMSRPLATGRDEWESYKCWVLCSMPESEFQQIADQFRMSYQELYKQTLAALATDRSRRVKWEDTVLQTQLQWQAQEREWNRADELVSRDHTISLDKDREPLPGRRFSVVGSSR